MNLTSFRTNQHYCLTALLVLNSLAGVLAQSVTVTALPNSFYKIGTTNLDPDDLVFYRFSDGYDLTAMSTSTDSEASVTRKFNSAGVSVSAFIARKNGPVELTTGDVSNLACANCAPPSFLQPGECMRLRPTSWSPFIDPAAPTSLTDNKTSPTCYTPGTPWFILPITIKASSASTYLDLSIPSDMTIKGAIVKNIWKSMTISQTPYSITDTDVQSFTYSSATSLRISMTSAYGTEFNVYLVVGSATDRGEESIFGAQLYSSGGSPLCSPSTVKTLTRLNPHDPNHLTALQASTCGLQTDNPPLYYQVDFQNLGEGEADTVIVQVMINSAILDHSTLSNITSKHTITSYQTNASLVTFVFGNINLVGLDQDPQPDAELTKGWVKFSLDPHDCLSLGLFVTNAAVTFKGNSGNFSETIQTNGVKQYISSACDPDEGCEQLHKAGQNESGFSTASVLISKCYPTVFEDVLHVDVPPSGEAGNIQFIVSDLTGRVHISKSYPTLPDTETREILNTGNLPAGLYLIQVRQGSKTDVFKVIKE